MINIASILISYFAGTLKPGELWLQTAAAVPALYLGFRLGDRFFHRIDSETFRKAFLVMVVVSSIALISATLLKQMN